MPNLIGGIIVGFIWQFIFNKAFESLATMTGIDFFAGWLNTPETGFWGLIILFVWQISGYMMLIYISFSQQYSRRDSGSGRYGLGESFASLFPYQITHVDASIHRHFVRCCPTHLKSMIKT